ncbi:MAG: hypothetical protein EBR82_61590 [Caulobacteraceae bacterium]|nr:hypothetical protein [Caulobacteraceae bacterium]
MTDPRIERLTEMVTALRQEGYNRQESIELLYARIEALEAAQQPADHIADARKMVDTGWRNLHDLSPIMEPAPPATAVGLVERVARVITKGDPKFWTNEARAAIREVAKWLDGQIEIGAAHMLRQEAER